jgi:membrane-associated phospholipid phosphatase
MLDDHPFALAVVFVSAILATAVFLDQTFFLWRAGLDPGVERIFRMATRIGNADWSILLALGGLIGFSLAARWSVRKADAVMWRYLSALSGFVLAAQLGCGLLANTLKWGLGRARPGIEGVDGVFTFAPIASSAGWASFPSGHSTTITALALALSFIAPRFRAAFTSVALWVAVSRIVVGAHWASDVVAGVCLGAATVVGLRHLYTRKSRLFVWRQGQLWIRTYGISRFLRRKVARPARSTLRRA